MIDGEVTGRLVEKPWGCDRLPARFGESGGRRIGEIWFDPPAEVGNLLAKYLFTSERVSVQAHATDEQTRARGIGSQGKDECWLVLEAEEGASLGIGFDRDLSPLELRQAALDGSIENMLIWYPVIPGDFYFIPANTVHAIGAGVTLLEVEQNSDLTYRLYDYGRGRDLHLDDGVAIAQAGRYPERLHVHLPEAGELELVNGPNFRLWRLDGPASPEALRQFGDRPVLALPTRGSVGAGGKSVDAGACAAASELASLDVPDGAMCLIAQAC